MTTFTFDDDAPILVEFAPRPGTRSVSRAAPTDLVAQSTQAINNAMVTIYNMARRVHSTVEAMGDSKPSEAEVSFGIKLNAETDALIAKVGGEASIEVTLTWKSKSDVD